MAGSPDRKRKLSTKIRIFALKGISRAPLQLKYGYRMPQLPRITQPGHELRKALDACRSGEIGVFVRAMRLRVDSKRCRTSDHRHESTQACREGRRVSCARSYPKFRYQFISGQLGSTSHFGLAMAASLSSPGICEPQTAQTLVPISLPSSDSSESAKLCLHDCEPAFSQASEIS